MSRSIVLSIAACALLCATTYAAIPEHLITSLPGFNGTFPSKQYSGYINVNETNGRFLHYWFVESENNPATDPVVLWMNGGPGCSSLDGYFYEQGPLHFVSDLTNDDVPALQLNPNRWNKIANMIFLEAPAGVGFSYSQTQSDYNTNDNQTAADNFQFLVNFFAKYPEYSKNRFFVSGESYAGVYVPTLVEQIMIHNDAGDSNIPLEGFLVGNGCTGNAVGVCGNSRNSISLDFLHGHGLYSESLYKQIQAACPDPDNPTDDCQNLLDEMSNEVGDVNIYDIYTDCINGASKRALKHFSRNMSNAEISLNSRAQRVPLRDTDIRVGGPDGCIDGILAGAYLNNDAVRTAIHVESASVTGTWTICTQNIFYTPTIDSLLGLYPTLISKYRVLIYNGDVDACVPYNDNEQWTSSLGYEIDQDWHQWLVNSQVAGYATSYKANGFQFITVKGSGHMVPEYRPVQALQMFTQFLNNQPF